MAEKKTLYHSELVKLGPVEVTVKSDILQSKFGKGDYVVLEVDGVDRNYGFDTPECQTPFDGQKGQTFTIVAEGSGKDGSAVVTYVGESGAAATKPAARAARPAAASKPAARPAAPPAQQNAANQPPRPAAHVPVPNGARVGACVNKAVDYLIASTQDWDPNKIYEYASDLMRVMERLEQNKLARPFADRTNKQAAE